MDLANHPQIAGEMVHLEKCLQIAEGMIHFLNHPLIPGAVLSFANPPQIPGEMLRLVFDIPNQNFEKNNHRFR